MISDVLCASGEPEKSMAPRAPSDDFHRLLLLAPPRAQGALIVSCADCAPPCRHLRDAVFRVQVTGRMWLSLT